MDGSTLLHAGFHPTCSMTCAGNRSEKRLSQSANVRLKRTVTVRPWFDPVTEAMSR